MVKLRSGLTKRLAALGTDCLRLCSPRFRELLKPVCGTKVVCPGGVDHRWCELQRAAFKRTNVRNPIQKIPGLTTLHGAAFGAVLTKQISDYGVVRSHAFCRRSTSEDLAIRGGCR